MESEAMGSMKVGFSRCFYLENIWIGGHFGCIFKLAVNDYECSPEFINEVDRVVFLKRNLMDLMWKGASMSELNSHTCAGAYSRT